MTDHPLRPLLAPRSIAFVGASPRPNSPGNDMLRMAALGGFTGKAFPINPNYRDIEGQRCYGSFAELPNPVDLAIVAVANPRLGAAMREAAAHGSRAAVIFASCHLENDESPPLTSRITKIARDSGMFVCGGNCMGFYNDVAKVWAAGFPAAREARSGHITFISHAGSIFGAFAHNDRRFRFNLVVSTGQELVTTAADYLDYALEQPETRVAGLFLETVRAPEQFARALEKAATRDIPVVVLKVGRTAAAAALALSHSGAIAGNDAAYEALFERYGVHRVHTLDEMGATLLLFEQGRRAASGGLAAIHDSGGERELVLDLAADCGVPYATIGPDTVARLRAKLDPGLEPINPLDAWGTGNDFVNIFADCFTSLLDDPDSGLGIFFNDLRTESYLHQGFAQAARMTAERTVKPVAYATNYSQVRHDGLAVALTEAGVPVLDGTVPALLAARHLLEHRDFLSRASDPPPEAAPRLDWRVRLAERPLDEADALALLAEYGISTLPSAVVDGADGAVRAAEKMGFPVVCKTAMLEIHHKTERGGVKLGLPDGAAVRIAYEDLARRLGPRVLIAPMADPGIELALGILRDAQFGPVVMVAAGGTLIELLRDASYALAPFGPATARRMLDRLSIATVLAGTRGAAGVDIDAAAHAIASFSVLAADLADLIEECDVNPLIVSTRGAVAVDALIIGRSKHLAAAASGATSIR